MKIRMKKTWSSRIKNKTFSDKIPMETTMTTMMRMNYSTKKRIQSQMLWEQLISTHWKPASRRCSVPVKIMARFLPIRLRTKTTEMLPTLRISKGHLALIT